MSDKENIFHSGNRGQNLLNNMKKSRKTGPYKKTLKSVFA